MANKQLFTKLRGVKRPDALNEAGGLAYKLTPEQTLAQYAMTGCLSDTFYAGAESQLDEVLALMDKVDTGFIARLAVYTRKQGMMKDMPALLLAHLASRDTAMLKAAFPLVIDNGRMLRNFVQIVRSGVAGRTSFGTTVKRLLQDWLTGRSAVGLFRDSVGQSPSLADVIKMVHPKPLDEKQSALFGYLIGRKTNGELLPGFVKAFERYKAGDTATVPDVPFQKLTALDLGKAEWQAIAEVAPWQMTRMNLSTFARHGVFEDRRLVKKIAERLKDAEAIAKARVFPYQLMMAYKMTASSGAIPKAISNALQDAMEVATENVRPLPGIVFVAPDVSGSMWSPVTGYRSGATSAVRCIDVAALLSATILRRNPLAEVMPFDWEVYSSRLNPRDSIMTNADRLAKFGGGGTAISAPLKKLNKRKAEGDLVILISDNESWADAGSTSRGTGLMKEWNVFRSRNPKARLVLLDIQPYTTSQAHGRADILNIGGFSDQVFSVIDNFASGRLHSGHWVNEINNVQLMS